MRPTLRHVKLISLFLLLALGYANRAVTDSSPQKKTLQPTTDNSSAPPIEVNDWTRPESGWLYVLDPKPLAKGLSGHIWLIDPEKGEMKGSVSTGTNSDFALSPDGATLYVASMSDGSNSDVAEIDTSNGAVLRTSKLENRMVAKGTPPYSSMSVSSDGLMLRILLNVPTAKPHDGIQLATFNAHTGDELPGRVHLGTCGFARFVSYAAADEFGMVCPTTNRLRRIQVDPKSRTLENAFVIFPWERRLGIAQALMSPGDQDLTIIRGDGAMYRMDISTGSVSETPVRGDVQGRIPPAAWPASPDGKRLYVGYVNYPNKRFYLDFDRSAEQSPRNQLADKIRVFDTTNWSVTADLTPSKPVWSAVTSNDGKSLYAMSPNTHCVLVFDTAGFRETRAIRVGEMPVLALVAP